MASSLQVVTKLTSALPEAMLWRVFCTPSEISATCSGVLTSCLQSLESNKCEHSWDVLHKDCCSHCTLRPWCSVPFALLLAVLHFCPT